jgi:hypothetical protein
MAGEYRFNKKIRRDQDQVRGRRYDANKNCTTTTAALANGCTMADLTWDWKHYFVEIFDPAL